MAYTHEATLSQTIIPMAATPQYGNPASAAPITIAPNDQTLFAYMTDAQMEAFAQRVAQAMIAIRAADGRSAVLATKQGVR